MKKKIFLGISMTLVLICLGYIASNTLWLHSTNHQGSTTYVEVPNNWKFVDADKFTLFIPRNWKFKKLQGIDSYVGEITGDKAKLGFDYGWYSNSLPNEGHEDYTVNYEVISGYQAKTVTPKDIGTGIVGIYFADIETEIKTERLTDSQKELALQFYPSGTASNSLVLYGRDLTAKQQETALKIFQTIQIVD